MGPLNILGASTTSISPQGDLKQIYHNVLNRDADTGGLATYAGLLANGTSLDGVRDIIAHSPEARGDLKQIYQDVLNRDADTGGLTTYVGLLANGASLDGVRDIIAHSPEATATLKLLFGYVLGRAPGAAELVGMEDHLGAAATQSSLKSDLKSTGTAGGYNLLVATPGNATLTAEPKTPTLFAFGDIAFGNDTIAGFDPTRDTIALSRTLVTDLTTLNNETSTVAGGSLITLNPSQSILITGVAPGSLGAANFRIA